MHVKRELFIYSLDCLSDYLKLALCRSPFTVDEICDKKPEIGRYLRLQVMFDPDIDRALKNAMKCESFLEESGCGFVTLADEAYPGLMKSDRFAPFGLFYEGRIENDWMRTLCVVGTRRPRNSSRQAAYQFGLECGVNGLNVCSGFAYGLDQDAMRGCVDGGGRAFGVLGCGLGAGDTGADSMKLRRWVVDSGGAMISQFPPHMPGFPYNFPMRNRTLALACPSVVAFQASMHSGVMITANAALDAGRDVAVHESASGDSGTASLIADGAQVARHPGDVTGCRTINATRLSYHPRLEAVRTDRGKEAGTGGGDASGRRCEARLYRFCDAWYILEDER